MSGIIERVKTSALKFHEDLNAKLQEKGKYVDALRLKVISFRDYYVDGDQSMKESPFYMLPQQSEDFASFVSSIRATGGGDEPETALEALALAIKSEWAKPGGKRRQIIVVWTDASAHPLEKDADAKPSNYPADMPHNFDELTDMWEGQEYMDWAAKRLIVYAPDAYPWTDIANNWDNTLHFPSKAGEGLADVEYEEILDQIASSV